MNTNKGQSKLESFKESFINILIGYFTALISQLIIFPWFDIEVSLTENLLIGLYFTLISLVRGYLIRRYFNKKLIKENLIKEKKYK